MIDEVSRGKIIPKPRRFHNEPAELKQAIQILVEQLNQTYPGLPNARWVALRLLDGDERIIEAVQKGELGELAPQATQTPPISPDLKLEVSS